MQELSPSPHLVAGEEEDIVRRKRSNSIWYAYLETFSSSFIYFYLPPGRFEVWEYSGNIIVRDTGWMYLLSFSIVHETWKAKGNWFTIKLKGNLLSKVTGNLTSMPQQPANMRCKVNCKSRIEFDSSPLKFRVSAAIKSRHPCNSLPRLKDGLLRPTLILLNMPWLWSKKNTHRAVQANATKVTYVDKTTQTESLHPEPPRAYSPTQQSTSTPKVLEHRGPPRRNKGLKRSTSVRIPSGASAEVEEQLKSSSLEYRSKSAEFSASNWLDGGRDSANSRASKRLSAHVIFEKEVNLCHLFEVFWADNWKGNRRTPTSDSS